MGIHMYICTHVQIHRHKHMHMCICTQLHTQTRIRAYAHKWIPGDIRTPMCTHTQLHTSTDAHTLACTYVQTDTLTYKQTDTHVHVHTYTLCVCWSEMELRQVQPDSKRYNSWGGCCSLDSCFSEPQRRLWSFAASLLQMFFLVRRAPSSADLLNCWFIKAAAEQRFWPT